MSLKTSLQQKLHEKNVSDYAKLMKEQQKRYREAYSELIKRMFQDDGQTMRLLTKTDRDGKSLKELFREESSSKGQNNRSDSMEEFTFVSESACDEAFQPEMIQTEYILFAKEGAFLRADFLTKAKQLFESSPEISCVYGHEDKVDTTKQEPKHYAPWFKPCWSPDTLLEFYYFGSYAAVRTEELKRVTWLRERNPLKNIYDAALQMTLVHGKKAVLADGIYYHKLETEDKNANLTDGNPKENAESRLTEESVNHHSEKYAKSMTHVENPENEKPEYGICKIKLGTEAELPGFQEDFADIKKNCYGRMGLQSITYTDKYHFTHIHPVSDGRKVSILIPSKDHPEVLKRCISSIRSKTEYSDYEILVVDNGSSSEEKEKYQQLSKEYQFSYFFEPMEFNFSALCNFLAEKAKGDYLLFLNDDMEIRQENWLRLMTAGAALSHVGAVGAKLYYPDGNLLQHAGITNLTEGPVHKLQGQDDAVSYYYGVNRTNRDMIGVTAACLMITKEKFHRIGGFAAQLAVAYNDVDLNFRLLQNGYFNLLLNDVVLIHYESLSRGDDMADAHKLQRLRKENKLLYDRNSGFSLWDPFYSSFLTGMSSDYEVGYSFENRNLQPVSELKKCHFSLPEEKRNETLVIQTDHAEKERPCSVRQGEFYLIDLHAHVRGLDNADYKFQMFLKAKDKLLEVPYARRYREDVVRILRDQMHVEMSGFAARLPRDLLEEGSYEIWMKARSLTSRQVLWNKAEKVLVVSGKKEA